MNAMLQMLERPGPAPQALGALRRRGQATTPFHWTECAAWVPVTAQWGKAREVLEGGRGRVWDPKVCVSEIPQQDFPNFGFRFSPRWSFSAILILP